MTCSLSKSTSLIVGTNWWSLLQHAYLVLFVVKSKSEGLQITVNFGGIESPPRSRFNNNRLKPYLKIYFGLAKQWGLTTTTTHITLHFQSCTMHYELVSLHSTGAQFLMHTYKCKHNVCHCRRATLNFHSCTRKHYRITQALYVKCSPWGAKSVCTYNAHNV
jgi:hypothetical protein